MTAHSPIFIVGLARSGTTLLSALLDAHPNIAIAPETWFVSHFASPLRAWDLSGPELMRLFMERYTAHDYFAHLGIEAEDLIERSLKLSPSSTGSVFELVLRTYAARFGKERWGEKTPHHYRHLDMLLDWFPDACVLFMVRDPRAAYASFRKTPFGHEWADKFAREWVECLGILENRKTDPRVLAVKYERLVLNTESELKRICEFISEEFAPEMTQRADSAYRTAPHQGWRRQHEQQALGPILDHRVDAWRDELDRYKIAIIEHYAGPMMTAFGYQPFAGLSAPLFCRMQMGRARRNIRFAAERLMRFFHLRLKRSAAG